MEVAVMNNEQPYINRWPLFEEAYSKFPVLAAPPVAVEALLPVEQIPHCIWEPAAGRGAIANVLRPHRRAVIPSDLHDYGYPLHFLHHFPPHTHIPIASD